MDSLKSLLDSKKYELVIKLTETSKEATDLFYRISAFIYLGQYENALYVIQDNQEVLQNNNMPSLIKAHIELLCALERYEQAYTVLDYYANLPYESQIVEETLRKMPEIIEQEEKRKNFFNSLNEDEIVAKLNSDKSEDVLFALDLIKKLDIFTYLPELSNILKNNKNQTVRSFALMLLVQKEVDREFDYLSYKGMIKVNPKKTMPPFTGTIFNSLVKRIDLEFKNATISQNAAQVISCYVIYTYPHQILNDEEEILGAIYLYTLALIQDNSTDIEEYCVVHNLNKDKAKQYLDLVETANNDF